MIALARKYRPKQFADLLVQEHVAAALRGAVAQNRVAHGYLFAGPRGVGKTTAARILAMALNCVNRSGEGEPCGVCASCQRIWGGAVTLDVVELDAASNRGVDDARDLRERAMYAASGETGYKVYIVDEAHMLTREAWNALLKILEEPPARVVFVFATTEPHKIAQAAAPILSRLQRFDFRRIGPHAVAARLDQVLAAEGVAASADAVRLIAQSADGGMRDGLSLLDQVLSFGEGPVTAERVREVLGLIPEDVYGEMLRLLVEQDARAVFPLVDRLVEDGADLGQFAAGAADVLRAVLLAGLGGTPEELSDELVALVRRYASRLPPADILRLLTVFGESEGQLRATGNARLAVEVLLLRWALMARTVDLADVMAALTGAGSPAPTPAPPPAPVAAAPPGPPSTTPAPAAPPVPTERGSASVERLRAVWPQVVTDARARSQMLGTLLAQTEVASVDGGTVAVRLLGNNATYVDGLERQRDVLVQLLSRYVADPLRVVVAPTGAGPAAKPARLTPEAVRADRLAQLRAGDPSLSAAVDALDLELLE